MVNLAQVAALGIVALGGYYLYAQMGSAAPVAPEKTTTQQGLPVITQQGGKAEPTTKKETVTITMETPGGMQDLNLPQPNFPQVIVMPAADFFGGATMKKEATMYTPGPSYSVGGQTYRAGLDEAGQPVCAAPEYISKKDQNTGGGGGGSAQYQGPVQPGVSESVFRETGVSKKEETKDTYIGGAPKWKSMTDYILGLLT